MRGDEEYVNSDDDNETNRSGGSIGVALLLMRPERWSVSFPSYSYGKRTKRWCVVMNSST